MNCLDLGLCSYSYALSLQYKYVKMRQNDQLEDLLIIVEHPPTITLGRVAEKSNIVADEITLAQAGIEVIEVNRGGDVTYHGPGQLVAYPIISLAEKGLDMISYLRKLEMTIVKALAAFKLQAHTKEGYTGVWLKDKKIAAIGIAVIKNVTMHGFAINNDPQMEHFEMIIPCGIKEYRVTSLKEALGRPVEQHKLKHSIRTALKGGF